MALIVRHMLLHGSPNTGNANNTRNVNTSGNVNNNNANNSNQAVLDSLIKSKKRLQISSKHYKVRKGGNE